MTGEELATVYEREGARVLGFLYRCTNDRAMAEDILHDVFLTLAKRPPETKDHLRPWLFRVATNRLRDIRKLEARRAALRQNAALNVQGDVAPDPDKQVEQREAQEVVRTLLEKLPTHYARLLLLREAGLTHAEIAEVMNLKTNAVGTMLARAFGKLRSLLETAGVKET